MADADFVLGHDQRDEIMKAVTAIRRQLKDIGDKPHWQAFWVIDTNLTIIQTSLTSWPPASSN
jgi:hypothetical protein